MASKVHQLHIFLFPFMAHGHTIPIIDMAKLFASRGIKITIVTTPNNAIFISKSIGKNTHNLNIELLLFKFPSAAESGLPDGCENADSVNDPETLVKFFKAMTFFQSPLEQALRENRPDCIVADMFFPWVNDVASKLGIPRLIFHGIGLFALCCQGFMRLHEPYKHVSSDTEPFIIPDLPGEIKVTKMELPQFKNDDHHNFFLEFLNRVHESEPKCYGVIVNSFYELEPEYADCYRNVLGRKAWNIGPLSLRNKSKTEVKLQRGKESAIDEHECLKWLDSKKPNSVIYICFGSMTKFSSAQLVEIANGVEVSGQQFIWVVRKETEENEDWLPEGFKERIEGKGVIIRGWAPQVLILDHPAIGGFVTHCGWNSILEGIAGGVPMITWPVFAEQFYNEKLITQVLKIGVSVGVRKWEMSEGDFIKREAIENAIRGITFGEEANEIRKRAREYGEMANKAVRQQDGSSNLDLNSLIQELKHLTN